MTPVLENRFRFPQKNNSSFPDFQYNLLLMNCQTDLTLSLNSPFGFLFDSEKWQESFFLPPGRVKHKNEIFLIMRDLYKCTFFEGEAEILRIQTEKG